MKNINLEEHKKRANEAIVAYNSAKIDGDTNNGFKDGETAFQFIYKNHKKNPITSSDFKN